MAKVQQVEVVARIVEDGVVLGAANLWHGGVPIGPEYDNSTFLANVKLMLDLQAGSAAQAAQAAQDDAEDGAGEAQVAQVAQ